MPFGAKTPAFSAKKKTWSKPRYGTPAGPTKVTTHVAPEYNPPARITREAPGQATQRRQKRARKSRQRQEARSYLKRSRSRRERQRASTEKRVKTTEKGVKATPPVRAAPQLSVEGKSIVKAINDAQPVKASKSSRPRPVPAKARPVAKPTNMDPATAVMSSVPGRGPKVTKQRRVEARRNLRKAKRAVRRTSPSLAHLEPEERAVVPLARKAHRKYPGVPASLLMSLMRQESGFQADAVSSANAQGLTQFIPSTAASYGVKYGTGPKEKQSQVTGAAKLLTDSNFAENPKEALTRYTGGYSDAEYNNPVLEGARDYAVVDKSGSSRAIKRYRKAVKEARSLGMKVGKPAADLSPGKGKTVYVRADAKGMVDWVESALGTVEGSSKHQRWAGKTGLGITEPWCASFVSNGLLRRGITSLPANPNYVPSYEEWGAKYAVKGGLAKAKPGDLLTFSGRHIGVYVGNGEMISGNSSDAVSRTGIDSDLSMVIRPPYKGGRIAVQESAALPGSVAVTSTSSSAPAALGLLGAPSVGGARKGAVRKAKLTPQQKYRRTARRLEEVGVGERQASPEPSPTLKALERKYGVAA